MTRLMSSLNASLTGSNRVLFRDRRWPLHKTTTRKPQPSRGWLSVCPASLLLSTRFTSPTAFSTSFIRDVMCRKTFVMKTTCLLFSPLYPCSKESHAVCC